MQRSDPRIAAVVLCWRAARQAVEAAEAVSDSVEVEPDVLVVDNGSGDDSVRLLRERLGDERVLPLPENRGYAGGMNAGLERARRRGADAFLLVTQDTIVEPTAVRRLYQALADDEGLGVVGPVVRYRRDPGRVFSAGVELRPGRAQIRRVPPAGRRAPYAVDSIDGCCMLIRPAVLDAVGLLDTRYFLYYEETDFCARVRQSGWRVAVQPSAEAAQARPDVPGPHYFYYMARNAYLFWHERYEVGAWTVARAQLIETARLAAWAVQGLIVPSQWPEAGNRVRRLALQVRGMIKGTRDHLRERYGAES